MIREIKDSTLISDSHLKVLKGSKGELDFLYITVENSNNEESEKLPLVKIIEVSKKKIMELLEESNTVRQFRNRLGSQSEIVFS